MSDGIAIALAAVGLGAVYFLTRPATAAAAAPASTPIPRPGNGPVVSPSAPSALKQLELSVPNGGLAATTGSLAQKAPTWLKVAVPVVGLNSAVQSFIDHPSATLSSIGHSTKNFATSTGSAIKGAATSVYHDVAGIF